MLFVTGVFESRLKDLQEFKTFGSIGIAGQVPVEKEAEHEPPPTV